MNTLKSLCDCPRWHQYCRALLYHGTVLPPTFITRVKEWEFCPYCGKKLRW